MKVTDLTRRRLAILRQRKAMTKSGYEEINCGDGIGRLWELDRGGRVGWRLTDAVLGVDGLSIFVKAENRRSSANGV